MAKIDLGLIRGSMWYQGTKITGQNTEGVIFPETGISEALKGDKYQNSETNDLYECIKGGAEDIAQWKWYGNISFGDISDRAVTYELPDTVDMSQIPASGGLLKNFVGWIFKSIFSLNSTWEATDLRINGKSLYNVNDFFDNSPTGLSYFVTTSSFAEDNRPDTSYKWGAGTGILLKRSVAEGTIILFEYGTNRYAIGSIVNSSFTGWAIK